MTVPLRLACLLAAIALVGCDRKAAPTAAGTPTPAPVSEPGYAGVPEASASPAALEAPAGEVVAPEQVNTDAANAENQAVKTEVLARIDVMPNLTPEEKDKLYVQVERARGMGKIITIPFASGKTAVGATEIAALQDALKLPQVQKFASDPTVIFVVLGFADKKGDPAKNQAISLQRADSVVSTLKRGGVLNITHAVGMGSSEIFDAQNLDKNRVVEVWAVLP